jgi:O-antigen/teichoic acid export membrane protein
MLKKISLVTVGNMFNAFLGFLYLWAVANTLPLDQFGKYSLFTSIVIVIGRLTDFGTNSTFVTRSILEKTKRAGFIYTKFFLTLAAFLIGLAVLEILNLLTLSFGIIFIISITAYSFNYMLYAFYQEKEKYTLLVLLYTLPALVKATAALLLYLEFLHPTVELTSAIFGFSVFAGALLLIKDNPLKRIKLSFKPNWNLLKEAWPAGISQTITEVWAALSNSIAKVIQGFSDVGVFALANKVSVVFSILSLSIFTVLLPKNAKRKKQELAYSFDEAALLTMLLLVMGIAGIISSKFVIANFFGPQFEKSLELLNILVFAAALSGIASFMENYFFIEQSTPKILAINISKLATFLVSVLILTPSLKLKGLAYSQLIAALTAVLITAILIFWPQKESLAKKIVEKVS